MQNEKVDAFMQQIRDFEVLQVSQQDSHAREVTNLQRLADLYKRHLDEAASRVNEIEAELKLQSESTNSKLASFKEKIGLQQMILLSIFGFLNSIIACVLFCERVALLMEENQHSKDEKANLEAKVGELESIVSDLQAKLDQSNAQTTERSLHPSATTIFQYF